MSPPPEIPPELREAGAGERELRRARERSSRSDTADRLMMVSAIGTEFAVAVIGGGALGWLLDWWLGTGPWLLLAGSVFGLVWGFTRFVRSAVEATRDGSTAKPGSRAATGPSGGSDSAGGGGGKSGV